MWMTEDRGMGMYRPLTNSFRWDLEQKWYSRVWEERKTQKQISLSVESKVQHQYLWYNSTFSSIASRCYDLKPADSVHNCVKDSSSWRLVLVLLAKEDVGTPEPSSGGRERGVQRLWWRRVDKEIPCMYQAPSSQVSPWEWWLYKYRFIVFCIDQKNSKDK